MKRKQPSPQSQSLSPSMASSTDKTPSLPLKTIQDILSRLPVKSIIRFESVSKRWLSIIRSPEFISAHLRRSSLFPSLLLRRFHNPTGSNFSLSSITNDGLISYREINVPFFGSLLRFPQIVGSYNGVLCVDISFRSASGFVLWNLATGQFRILPKPLTSEGLEGKFWMVASGFGCNSVVDDYKVVRVVSFLNSSSVRAEVFDLKVGSWRLIDQNAVDDGIRSCVISEGEKAVTVNGGLHWIANGIGESSGLRFLVSFDMGTDSFVTLQTPDVSENVCMKLMRFKDSVAMALYPVLPVYPGYGRSSVDRIELWVLDDCGGGMDGKKWSKLHSIPSGVSQLAYPIEILNDSELVLKRVENDVITLLFYNPGKQTVKRFPICSNEFSCQVYSYVDSLVPVFKENNEAVLEDGQ